MANSDQYFQCRMRRGTSETVGWIAAKGAKEGARVELLPTRDVWEVVEVYDHAMPQADLKELQQMHRGSLPSVERMV